MNAIICRALARRAVLALASVAAMAALPARAESPDLHTEVDRAVSMKSRAEVRAELEEARRSGTIHAWSDGRLDWHAPRMSTIQSQSAASAVAATGSLPITRNPGLRWITLVSPQHHEASRHVAHG